MLRSILALVLSGCATLASVAGAVDLPPKEAPSFSGTYRALTRGRDAPAAQWKYVTEDTVTIAVDAKRSRWDHKLQGETRIYDSVSRYVTVFGGKTPPKTAYRSRSDFVPIGWEFGYATVARATETDPEVLGTTTIAGRSCTRLRYTSEQYGTPEFCVAANGIVLRFENASSTAEATYEATSITEERPATDRFTVPSDLTVEEKRFRRLTGVP
jgi:hypothetical protein